jgi:hypothetical protein
MAIWLSDLFTLIPPCFGKYVSSFHIAGKKPHGQGHSDA